ncbi:Bifunctional ligase/repressor BirA [Paraurantiacibacter namhicola]|uniref:biotin--[biotin carboxyl-carrier protein] ligase n=1 Tax=Paraurantiacibacter namhicola TaxID=645517 RepID=A0A1C7D9I4_9SPHN|nr:Bifunctional ligase/repressor BirA [Paraurantiacibacter namhicola]
MIAETGSTNADLVSVLKSGERWPKGQWLVADRQTAGKGRQGRAWKSASGNFTGSTAVHLTGQEPPAASLSFVASLAIYEALVGLLADPAVLQLKWPNDVMLNGGKASGILLERHGDSAVVGIGVNLASAPDLPDRRTAALADFGPAPSRDDFAGLLAASFDKELVRWRQFGLEPILARWQAAAHRLGTRLSVHDATGARLSGTFDGLDTDGALLLRLPDGSRRAIHAGDVMLEES